MFTLDHEDISDLSRHRRAVALPVILHHCLLIVFGSITIFSLSLIVISFFMTWWSGGIIQSNPDQYKIFNTLLDRWPAIVLLIAYLSTIYLTLKQNRTAAAILLLFYVYVFGDGLHQASQGWPNELELARSLAGQANAPAGLGTWSPLQLLPALLYELVFKAILFIFAYRMLWALLVAWKKGRRDGASVIFPPSVYSTPGPTVVQTFRIAQRTWSVEVLGRAVIGAVFKTLYVIMFLLAIILPYYISTWPYRSSLILSDAAVESQIIGIVVTLVWARVIFFVSTKVFLQLSGRVLNLPHDKVARAGRRPPILYLRSFRSDILHSSSPTDMELVHYIYPYGEGGTLEQLIVRRCRNLGPIVAIAEPAFEQPLGAARLTAGDDDWQRVVMELAGQSSRIIILMDVTTGLDWELDMIERDGHLMKTIFVFPVPQDGDGPDDAQTLMVDTVLRMAGANELQFPAALSKGDIRAITCTPTEVRFVTSTSATFADYDIALTMFIGERPAMVPTHPV